MAFEATVAPALLRGNGSLGPLLHFPNYYAGFRRFGFQLESQLPRLNMSYQMSELVFDVDVVIDRPCRRGVLEDSGTVEPRLAGGLGADQQFPLGAAVNLRPVEESLEARRTPSVASQNTPKR